MILLLHIVIASLSVFYTVYAFFFPTQNKLKLSYLLLALTIISGGYLIVTMPAHMTQTCETGLAYVGVMLIGILAIKHRIKNSAHFDRAESEGEIY